jgi:hypothetical protein
MLNIFLTTTIKTMAKGTVKDPTGHQSQPHDFGYLQRQNESDPNLKWADETDKLKAIPFLTKKPDGTIYEVGQELQFHPKTVGVFEFRKFGGQVFVGPFLGTIGIAEIIHPEEGL